MDPGMDPFGTAKGASKTAGTGRVDPLTPTRSRPAAAAVPQAPGRSSTRPRTGRSCSRTRSPRRKAPKVNIPDAYDRKDKGRKAKQWWTRMMICINFEKDKFPEEDDMMVWVLQNMEDKAADKKVALSILLPNKKWAAVRMEARRGPSMLPKSPKQTFTFPFGP
ncbi:hypothetical protein FRC10_005643, partial [Ceratobasidium sp. 414]